MNEAISPKPFPVGHVIFALSVIELCRANPTSSLRNKTTNPGKKYSSAFQEWSSVYNDEELMWLPSRVLGSVLCGEIKDVSGLARGNNKEPATIRGQDLE
jgi:hypothetical protein